MRLSISPPAFQAAILEILQRFLLHECVVFLDDILIYTSGSRDEHLKTVRAVFRTLQDAGALLELRKVKMAQSEVTFLGLTLSASGWSVSTKFLDAVNNIRKPRTIKQLRGLIGL